MSGGDRHAPIIGDPVLAAWPARRTDVVHVAVYGEAPGRYGADKSGIPFWGDRAARVCYAALAEAGVASWEGGAETLALSGLELVERKLKPAFSGVMLSNAYDRCPAASPTRIRPPTREELTSAQNVARIRKELLAAHARGCRLVLALGRVAGGIVSGVLESVAETDGCAMRLVVRPHPSAQGLLQAAPNRGRGCKMVELEAGWIQETAALIRRAGR